MLQIAPNLSPLIQKAVSLTLNSEFSNKNFIVLYGI